MGQTNQELWLERQADLWVRIGEYGTHSRFGAFLFMVATGGLFRAILLKLFFCLFSRERRLAMAERKLQSGQSQFVEALTEESKAIIPIYMLISSTYTFVSGRNAESHKASMAEMKAILRRARWNRVRVGANTCELDMLTDELGLSNATESFV